MMNYTSPTAHLEQRRGVVGGGSVVARNRVMNASLWSIVPPSVSAGCGGIDMFAGSFSFISGAQFQQLMRSIAANALTRQRLGPALASRQVHPSEAALLVAACAQLRPMSE